MLRQRFFILFLCLVITSAIVGPVESANPKSKQSPRMYPVLGYQIPLHDLEEVPEDEEQAIADTNAIVGEFFRKTYANPHTDTGSGLTFAGTRRGVHPKAHGCLVGRMKVSKHLFRSDRVGIFKEPSREYNVFVRFSNGSPRPNANDSDPDSRGFGLKVIDVPGENMLKNVVGSGQVTTQEFTMNSSDAFFADTAERYRDFMRIALLETDSFSNAATEHVISLFKSFHPFLALRVKSAFERIRDVALKTTNPLSLQYFSITPFQHGVGPSAPIVKNSLRPCNGIWEDPVNIAYPNF